MLFLLEELRGAAFQNERELFTGNGKVMTDAQRVWVHNTPTI